MSTTVIFVEILITGIQASIWIALLVFAIFGAQWLPNLFVTAKDWVSLITVFVFAIWYSLGIVFDRVAGLIFDNFLKPKELLLRLPGMTREQEPDKDNRRMALLMRENGAATSLDYYMSRERITRATTFNTILITLAALFFLFRRCGELGCASPAGLIFGVFITGVILFVLSYLSLGAIAANYEARLQEATNELKKMNKSKRK